MYDDHFHVVKSSLEKETYSLYFHGILTSLSSQLHAYTIINLFIFLNHPENFFPFF